MSAGFKYCIYKCTNYLMLKTILFYRKYFMQSVYRGFQQFKMARTLVILISVFIMQFGEIWAQSILKECPCNNFSTGATWRHMLNSTECRGKCDVAQRMQSWTCIIDKNTTTVCKRMVSCVINDTCEGTWAPWASIGRCNATCGKGFRPRARTCYKEVVVRIW